MEYFLEVTLALAVFHSGFAAAVIGASTTFGNTGSCHFRDNVVQRSSCTFDGTGAGGIANRAETYDLFLNLFIFLRMNEIGDGKEASTALKNLALVLRTAKHPFPSNLKAGKRGSAHHGACGR